LASVANVIGRTSVADTGVGYVVQLKERSAARASAAAAGVE
jgi:hypothetical protein